MGFTVQTFRPYTYEEQWENRILRAERKEERYLTAAANQQRAAKSADQAAHDLSRGWEPGQPILVGHHSEERARRERKRVRDLTTKSGDHQEKAKDLKQRAEGVVAQAYRRKGAAAERDQRYREAITAMVKVGDIVEHGGTYHPLHKVVKINRKSFRVRNLTTGNEYTDDKISFTIPTTAVVTQFETLFGAHSIGRSHWLPTGV
jgi:hypothetical protein